MLELKGNNFNVTMINVTKKPQEKIDPPHSTDVNKLITMEAEVSC